MSKLIKKSLVFLVISLTVKLKKMYLIYLWEVV